MSTPPSLGDPNWNMIATTRLGDDLNEDILWRNALNGELVLWDFDDSGSYTVNSLSSLGPWLSENLVGDFDGNGKADVWLHNPNSDASKMLLDSANSYVNTVPLR